jgi:hypothetical protein
MGAKPDRAERAGLQPEVGAETETETMMRPGQMERMFVSGFAAALAGDRRVVAELEAALGITARDAARRALEGILPAARLVAARRELNAMSPAAARRAFGELVPGPRR